MTSPAGSVSPRGVHGAVGPLVLAGLVLALLGDLFFLADGTIASHAKGDAVRSFFYLREFGFGELRAGNLPLWNPHLFSGTPFVGSFQSAMFYPPNYVHLVAPVSLGINFEFAFNVWVLAVGAHLWARGRGLSFVASLLCAGVAAFGATVWLRVLAGALTVLATYAWVPWLLASIDALARKLTLGWWLVATLAASMTLLAGHPPTAFMSAFVLAMYCVPALWRSRGRARLVGALLAAGALSVSIAGVQLAPGYDASVEGIRRAGVDFAFATSWSFPPENLLTLFVPSMFGDATATQVRYLGRWWYWDDMAYIGVTASVLAAVGVLATGHAARRTAMWLGGLLVVLALGRYTPLYRVAFEHLPAFDLIRAPSKFMYFASLFLALLAGIGLDRLIGTDDSQTPPAAHEAPDPQRMLRIRVAWAAGLFGVLVGVAGFWSMGSASSASGLTPWSPIVLLASLNEGGDLSPRAAAWWARTAGQSLLGSGALFVVIAVVVRLAARTRWLATGLVVIGLAELLWFAGHHRGGNAVDLGLRQRAGFAGVLERAGTGRIMEVGIASNAPLGLRGYSVWGYDPVVLDRYSTFMGRSQGVGPLDLDNVRGRPPSRDHRHLRMLRLTGLVGHGATRWSADAEWTADPLPRLLFVSGYRVEKEREAILDLLDSDAFDPLELVVLEAPPDVEPSGFPPNGSATIFSESTDHLDIEAELDAPAILIVTDAYSAGWRAKALPGSVQSVYVVRPANLVLRAIALERGRHRIRLEYVPPHNRLGQLASGLGIATYGVGVVAWIGARARKREG